MIGSRRPHRVLSSVLAVAAAIAPAAAGAVVMRVTGAEDSGPGTLRAAIEVANENRAVAAIWFAQRGLAIELVSGLEYTGTQALFAEGLGATLRSVTA